MPIGSSGSPVFIAGFGITPLPMTDFYLPAYQPPRYTISGVTKDANGVAMAGATVEVFETVSGLLRGSTVSDASGNYSLGVTGGGSGLTFFCVAYLVGTPDLAGTTVNTLVGT